MSKNIYSIVIDEEKILATQAQLQPFLAAVDALKNSEMNAEAELAKWIELRMGRYTNRLADEFKVRKEKDRKEVFDSVIQDIISYSNSLLTKESVTWQDLSVLHTKLYPKGLWGQARNSKWNTMLAKFPTGEFREKEEFVKTSAWDFYFLPYKDIPDALTKINAFFYGTPDTHFLIQLILRLSYISHVHPYCNGNGTVLYFYMAILLLKNDYPIPFSVDEYFTNPNIGRDLALCNGGIDYTPLFRSFLESFLVK